MSEERESILRIVVDATEAKKRLTENVAALEKNKAELALLNKALKDNRKAYEEGQLSLEEYETASATVAQKIVEAQKEVRQLSANNRDLQKALDAPIGSLNDQRAQLTQLLRAYDNFVVGVDGTEEELKSLEAEIQKVTKAVGGQEDATGRAQRKVGSYEDAIKKALASNNGLSGSVGNLTSIVDTVKGAFSAYQDVISESTKALGSFTTSVKEADLSAKGLSVAFTNLSKTSLSLNSAMKVLRLTMLALPLFAIIAALTSLVAFFSSTQRGADLLSKAITPLRVIFDKLLGVLQSVGQFLFDNLTKAFQNPTQAAKDLGNAIVENIEKRFEALGKFAPAISKLFSGDLAGGFKDLANASLQLGTGIENVIDKVSDAASGVSDFISDAVKEGSKIADLNIAIEKAEIAIIKRRAEANKIIKEQQLLADDVTKSEEERIAATLKAETAIESLRKEEIRLFDLRKQLLDLEQSLNDTSREGEKEAAELAAARADAEAGLTDRLRKQITKRASLQTELNGTLRQLNLQQLKDQEQSLQQQLSNEQLSFDERIELLQKLTNTRTAIERKGQEDILEDTAISEKKKQVAIAESNRNILQIEAEFEAQKKELRKEQAQSDADFRATLADLERAAFEQQFAINAEYGAATLEQSNELYEAELAAINTRYEAEQLAAQGNGEQLLALSKEYDLQLTDAAAKEANRRKAIRQAEFKQQSDVINATKDIFNTLQQAFGQNTAAAKVLAKTNATLAYVQELQNIAASAQSPLFAPNLVTGGAAGAAIQTVQTIAATGRYIANIATIAQAGAGGDFVTSKPTMLLVGEAGRERVQVTPLGARGTTIIPPSSGLRRTPENDLIARRSGNQQQVREVQVPVLVVEDYQRTANRVQIAEKRANGNR